MIGLYVAQGPLGLELRSLTSKRFHLASSAWLNAFFWLTVRSRPHWALIWPLLVPVCQGQCPWSLKG